MSLNANWVAQVLRDRGAMPPPARQIEAYLESLNPADLAAAAGLIQAVLRGTEGSHDLEDFLSSLRGHPTVSAGAALPAGKVIQITSRRITSSGDEALDLHEVALLREQGFHVYSTKAAMKVELSLAQRSRTGKKYTISLDLAKAVAPRVFDWEHKLTFQFMQGELPLLGAMLLGYSTHTLTLKNHGPASDKFLEIADQGGKLFVKLRQGANARALPVDAGDVHTWAGICLTALRLNTPAIDGASQLKMLQRVGQMGAAS